MSNLVLFIVGFSIFGSYMFFLLRMIWKQHNIQKNSETIILKLRNEENEKQAS
ncbi:MAG: hypothetical protein MK105_17510 [Crocinitomicaceae bacterium]|nr:hypothetical protein [Crocinitomicaceae bacterium]